MTTSYCLTVEVKSEHIENGLGYMVAFRLPSDTLFPADLPEFPRWQEDVTKIILRSGDQCLHSDPYTKKLAIANMMHDLSELNGRYNIQIGSVPDVPAIQIHSTNPFDNTLEIDFSGPEGAYTIVEKGLDDIQRSAVSEHGKTGLTEAARKSFPFKKSPSIAVPEKKPASPPSPPKP